MYTQQFLALSPVNLGTRPAASTTLAAFVADILEKIGDSYQSSRWPTGQTVEHVPSDLIDAIPEALRLASGL